MWESYHGFVSSLMVLFLPYPFRGVANQESMVQRNLDDHPSYTNPNGFESQVSKEPAEEL